MTQFDQAFQTFFEHCKTVVDAHLGNNQLHYTKGRRYIKIINGGSAWAFVDITNGDILKPATWTSPAKHARGNIFDHKGGAGSITCYGPKYLK